MGTKEILNEYSEYKAGSQRFDIAFSILARKAEMNYQMSSRLINLTLFVGTLSYGLSFLLCIFMPHENSFIYSIGMLFTAGSISFLLGFFSFVALSLMHKRYMWAFDGFMREVGQAASIHTSNPHKDTANE